MWQIILYFAVSLVAIYAFTATIFLFFARLEKNAEGKIVLDPDSWHFKVAYPGGHEKVRKAFNVLKDYGFNSFLDNYERRRAERILASYSRGLCAYFFKFFLMLYIGWLFLVTCAIILGVVFNFFALPFGRYYRALASLIKDEFILKKYPLPRVYGIRLLPIYFIAPFLYGALWYLYPDPGIVLKVTGFLLGGVGVGALIVFVVWAIVSAIRWLRRTDEKSVSMLREYIAAKKEGVCPTMEIKIQDA